jgi:hypothetical protein
MRVAGGNVFVKVVGRTVPLLLPLSPLFAMLESLINSLKFFEITVNVISFLQRSSMIKRYNLMWMQLCCQRHATKLLTIWGSSTTVLPTFRDFLDLFLAFRCGFT